MSDFVKEPMRYLRVLNVLKKSQGGEGSRGGKIIGHTKSGKPIYEDHAHPSHAGFTPQEQGEAAETHHNSRIKEFKNKMNEAGYKPSFKTSDFSGLGYGSREMIDSVTHIESGKKIPLSMMSPETRATHSKAYDLINNYRDNERKTSIQSKNKA